MRHHAGSWGVHVVVEVPTRLAPDALYGWWTDYGDGMRDHAFLARERRAADGDGLGRTVVARGADRLDIVDRGRFAGLPLVEQYAVHLKPDRREVLLYGANNFSRFTATYRFEEGRATLDAHVAPVGILAAADRLLAPAVRRFLRKDLEGHVRDAERDLDEGQAQAQGRGQGKG